MREGGSGRRSRGTRVGEWGWGIRGRMGIEHGGVRWGPSFTDTHVGRRQARGLLFAFLVFIFEAIFFIWREKDVGFLRGLPTRGEIVVYEILFSVLPSSHLLPARTQLFY